MLTVPALTPVTRPVPDTTVALAVLPLLQVPPVVASVTVMGEPLTDTVLGPPIAAGAVGRATTLTDLVALQPAEVV